MDEKIAYVFIIATALYSVVFGFAQKEEREICEQKYSHETCVMVLR